MATYKKVQVWLRTDQADLVLHCLRHVRAKIVDDMLGSGAMSKVAGPFTRNRLDEVIILIEQAQAKAAKHGDL